MNIFLTGGTGFIGSHLLRLLGSTAHRVTALRRKTGFPCIEVGTEPLWLEEEMDRLGACCFSNTDVFVHLASVGVSPKFATWNELLYWNVLVMLKLFEKAYEAGVRQFVVAGSFAEYGLSADKYDYIPVDAPLTPTSPYAASKAASFVAAHAFAIEKQIKLSYLRIFSAYGEGQCSNNFWPALRTAAINGEDFMMTPGGQVRDYIPVESVAEFFLKTIENINMVESGVPQVANVGSGNPVTMLEFAQYFWTKWGAKGQIIAGAKPYRLNEPMRFVPLIQLDQG